MSWSLSWSSLTIGEITFPLTFMIMFLGSQFQNGFTLWRSFWEGFACALVFSIAWGFGARYEDQIAGKVGAFISNEWIMLPALLTALLFYRLRGSHSFAYGLAEVLFGAIFTWSGIRAGQDNSFLAQAIAFFGGLYIIVRGL